MDRCTAGNRNDMATDVDIDRALAALSATLNDKQLESYDPDRVQEIVTESLGAEQKLHVDDGGGLHDETGARIGAIRRTDSGEWIVDRQNTAADRSDTAVPKPPPQSRLRKVLRKLKVTGS
jgi:hypothetical protein